MTDFCGIYIIQNKLNDKVYIGQSIHIYTRWKEHVSASFNKNSADYNFPIHKAIRKYGVNNFTFRILELCCRPQLDYKEIFWIKQYNATQTGYNISKGGQDRSYNGRKVNLYDLQGNYVKSYGSIKECAEALSVSYGTVYQVIQGKRKSCKNYQIKYADKTKKIEKYQNNQGGKIPINQYTKDGYFIKTWESATAAARALNLDASTITKCVKGKLKTHGGFAWKYKEANL